MAEDCEQQHIVHIGAARIVAAVQRTREAYERVGRDETSCTCDMCVNYEAAFPLAMLPLLAPYFEQLGIDYRKPAEIVHYNRERPGAHCYQTEWRFYGTIDGDSGAAHSYRVAESIEIEVTREGLPAPDALCGPGSLVLSVLSSAVPWVIDRPEPD